MSDIDRKRITKFLSHLTRSYLSGSHYASEVSVDACSCNVKRVDFMQFKPDSVTSVSGIEKGIFICYEVKSCLEDIYSGNGLNFLGEKNYLVMTIDCYKQFLTDFQSGKFKAYLHNNYPESSDNFGIKVAVPERKRFEDEFEVPSEVPFNEDWWNDWKLVNAMPCYVGLRKRAMTELLFCMLRSGR